MKKLLVTVIIVLAFTLCISFIGCTEEEPKTTTAGTTTAAPATSGDNGDGGDTDSTTTPSSTTTNVPYVTTVIWGTTTPPITTTAAPVTTTVKTTQAPPAITTADPGPDNVITFHGDWVVDEEDIYTSFSESALIEIGNTEAATGIYTANIKGVEGNANLDAALFFAASDSQGDRDYWEDDASYYALFVTNGKGLGLARMENGWKGWVTEPVTIPDYNHGDTVAVKAVVYADGTIKCYANGNNLFTVNVGADKLYGTGYGYRSRIKDATFYGFEYTPLWVTENGSVTYNPDGTIEGGTNSIALFGEKEGTAAGIYTMKFTNTAEGDNGLVFAHTRTGNNTWEGEGTSYYFAFVSESGLYLGKADTTDGGWKVIKNDGADDIPNFTKEGEHTITIAYDGNGSFDVTLDGVFIYSVSDSKPLTGTGYGFRSGKGGTVMQSLEKKEYNPDTYEDKYRVLIAGASFMNDYNTANWLERVIVDQKGGSAHVQYCLSASFTFNGLANDSTDYEFREALNSSFGWDAVILVISRRVTPPATDVIANELAVLKNLIPEIKGVTDNVFIYAPNAASKNPAIYTVSPEETNYLKTDAKETKSTKEMTKYWSDLAYTWAEELDCGVVDFASAYLLVDVDKTNAGYLRAVMMYNVITGLKITDAKDIGDIPVEKAAELRAAAEGVVFPE